MKTTYTSGFTNSPKSFQAYPRPRPDFDFDLDLDPDLESGSDKKPRKPKNNAAPLRMIKSIRNTVYHYSKLLPVMVLFLCLSIGILLLLVLSMYSGQMINVMPGYKKFQGSIPDGGYPFPKLRNLVMVAGHSVYTSTSCAKAEKEDAWYLEPYQKHPGQATTFLNHIQKGVEIAAADDETLLLFSGGETRKDAGPRSEAQSYWTVADSKQWFGKQDSVRSRTLTEEHARDSFENLLFSICRFRELTGAYPHNITVVGYNFKEDRFVDLHRSAIRFPESRFFYVGTPSPQDSREAALKGEALVRAQFQEDPYGCLGSLHHKKLGRDPFHRSIPYPNGCPEIKNLFSYCGTDAFPGWLPWN